MGLLDLLSGGAAKGLRKPKNIRHGGRRLSEILEAHQHFCSGREGGVRADLSAADLRLADLHQANLTGAILAGANLAGASLKQAKLGRADLSGADLRGADLQNANLRDADLSGTKQGELPGTALTTLLQIQA